MSSFVIQGGKKLKGEITPQGAKNEALQILSAVLLTPEKVTIHNIPNIRDVNKLIDLIESIGVKVEKLNDSSYAFTAKEIDFDYLITEEYREKSTTIRGSIMMIGPLLARFGKGYIPKPGGDKIGRRRVDIHFIGFEKLGAKFEFSHKDNSYKVKGKNLHGAKMLLEEASVTGTANIIMTAVLAKGQTIIYNAACEPYIQQLCKMLVSMGAKISGIGSNLLTIDGVKELKGCEHTILPDMIEIGSFIGLAAMTGSEITIKNVSFENLGIIPTAFRRLGIQLEKSNDDIYIPRDVLHRLPR